MTSGPQGLREARDAACLSQEELAAAVGVAVSTVRAWESGASRPWASRRRALSRRLGTPLYEVASWFDGADGTVEVDASLGHYAKVEQEAGRLQAFEPLVLPGLLQTRDYAVAVACASHEALTAAEIELRVESRLFRQRALVRRPRPLDLVAVIDSSVLQRVTGSPEVMMAQLEELVAAAEMPNIEVRVLPLDGRVHCAAFGAFQLFTHVGGSAPYMACAEDLAGVRYYEGKPAEQAIRAHAALFAHLCEFAHSPAESIDLIRIAAKEISA